VEATKLFNDANAMLDKIIKEKWLTAEGVIGFWEAYKTAPDTVVLKDSEGKELTKLEFLRQQIKKAAGQPNYSLADFVAPGTADYIGAFAVSIHGIESYLQEFIRQNDDYSKITLQALADRFAEAFAEVLHARVRKEFWGYAKEESLQVEELIKESYQGIRPAPGYPACPDHTEKNKLFNLLKATENAGIQLTESLAMYPAASVCGWYFSHPQSTYFGVGKILQDQLEDYTKRKGMSIEDMSRWLSPILE
jgi:5-methyltetrahydrofolate--homocysteine methyltransferase